MKQYPMKIFKHIKVIKAKGIKLKRRLKVRLSAHKLKKHTGRKYKKMFTSHTAMLSPVDDENITAQNIPLQENILQEENISSVTERTSKLSSSKYRKKCNKETANKYITEDTTKNDSEQQIQEKEGNDWRIDISDKESEWKIDDDWIQHVPIEQRNLDSPIVVKMPLDDQSALNVPKIFKQQLKIQSEMDTYDRNVFIRETWSTEDNAHIINSECVNPDNIYSLTEYEKLASSSMSWETNETDKNEDNRAVSNSELENVTIDKAGNAKNISAYVCRESVESSERSTSSNNDARSCKSLQLEDNTELYESDLNSEIEDDTASCSRLVDIDLQDFKNVKVHSDKVQQLAIYCIRDMVIVIMKEDTKFGFVGKLSIKMVNGAVKVYGATLTKSNSPMEVYSPRGHSHVVVRASKEYFDDSIDDKWTYLAAEGITRDLEVKLQKDIDSIKPNTAVLVLRNIENNLTHFLKTHYPLTLFPDIQSSVYYPWTHFRRAEVVLKAQLYITTELNHKGLSVDPHIEDIVNEMLEHCNMNRWSCTLVAGGKSVGKSTNVRFLINKLLSAKTCKKVILVDLDPGQSECTPPSCISYSLIEKPLLGPNFTHLQTPVYQLFIDQINITQCISYYLEAMNMLIVKLKSCPELSRFPIVVNTMGFTKDMGWDIIITTIKLIKPSAVVQISSQKENNNYKDLLDAYTVNRQHYKWTFQNKVLDDWNKPCNHKLHVLNSNTNLKILKKWNMEPYQHREVVMISYLSGITHDIYNSFRCKENLPFNINDTVPYMAPFSSLCIRPQRHFNISASHAMSVINGNIVALCGVDLLEESSQNSDDTSDFRVLTHNTPLCTYGFGIIRGVDMEQKEVFVSTPLSESMMQHINCLAGCIPIPPWLLQVNKGAPYIGVNASLPTSRKHRKGVGRGFFGGRQKKSKTDNRRPSYEVMPKIP